MPSVPLIDYAQHLGTGAKLLCTRPPIDVAIDQPSCGRPAIVIVSIGSAYAVCRRHLRDLATTRVLAKTDTGSLAALGPDRLWHRVSQTWYRNELDNTWHRFRRLNGHDGAATYLTLMDDPTITRPCDFAAEVDAAGRTVTRNEWVCEGDVQLSSDAPRSRGVIEHPPSFSASIPCSSSDAVALLAPTVRDTRVAILACQAHTSWLIEHGYVDDVYSGVMARQESGRWVTARTSRP